jgi:hypothetical protein
LNVIIFSCLYITTSKTMFKHVHVSSFLEPWPWAKRANVESKAKQAKAAAEDDLSRYDPEFQQAPEKKSRSHAAQGTWNLGTNIVEKTHPSAGSRKRKADLVEKKKQPSTGSRKRKAEHSMKERPKKRRRVSNGRCKKCKNCACSRKNRRTEDKEDKEEESQDEDPNTSDEDFVASEDDDGPFDDDSDRDTAESEEESALSSSDVDNSEDEDFVPEKPVLRSRNAKHQP